MKLKLPHTAIVMALALLTSDFAFAADPMGAVVAVQGRPTAAGPGGSRALSSGSDVFEGDTVTVGDGNAQLQLDDGTKLVVGPSSRLLLQSYLRRNNATASKVGIKALRGTFRFITGNSPKSAYKISTTNATIGIRGTGFDFTVKNRTLIAVLKGAVRVRGSNGQAVNTASGCGVAEAGSGGIRAQELNGEAKANALQNELPYITDQSGLNSSFYLPVKNCFVFLGSNEGAPGIGPQLPLLAIPALAIPAAILLNQKDDPISPESTPSNPIITPGFPPYCDTPAYPVPCK
jgi:FecR protein